MYELHLHIDGSIRRKTLKEWRPDICSESFGFKPGMNLFDCLSCFKVTVEALNSPRRIERVVREICEDQRALGVKKSELRFAPHIHNANAKEMLDGAVTGLDKDTDLILCGLYGFRPEMIEELVDLAKSEDRVVGIDIAGSPKNTDKWGLHHYIDAYKEAKKYNIGRTVHVSEGRSPQEIIDAIRMLDAQRLGHACTLLKHEGALELVKDKEIVIEACITSNVDTGIYKSVSEHPIKKWINMGVKVAICADNSLMSRTNTLDQFRIIKNKCSLSDKDIDWCHKSARDSLFRRTQ